MFRTLLAFSFCALFTVQASAQDIDVQETSAMRAAAEKRTAQVDKQVKLNAEQRTQINAFYLSQEKLKAALEIRYANVPAQDKENDMKAIGESMAREEEKTLATLLTPEQVQKLGKR
jgi:hypothetical protein